MVHKTKKILAIMLLEICVLGVVAALIYVRWSEQRLERQRSLATRINVETIVHPENSELKYYITLKPDEVQVDSPAWLGRKATLTYNHDGLNERLDYAVIKPADTLRIVTLGDSFTFGQYISTPENWTELLEVALNKSPEKLCGARNIEVINLGMPGFDVEYITKRYKEIGAKYKPDMILWFESGSGFNRMRELLDPMIEACQSKQTDDEKMIAATSASKLYDCWRIAEKQLKEQHSPEEIRTRIGAKYREVFALVQPNPLYIFGYQDIDPDDAEEMRTKYLNGIEHVVFDTSVPSQSTKTRLQDGHPNKRGHLVMQQTIQKYLEAHQAEFCVAFQATASSQSAVQPTNDQKTP